MQKNAYKKQTKFIGRTKMKNLNIPKKIKLKFKLKSGYKKKTVFTYNEMRWKTKVKNNKKEFKWKYEI